MDAIEGFYLLHDVVNSRAESLWQWNSKAVRGLCGPVKLARVYPRGYEDTDLSEGQGKIVLQC